MAVVSALRIAPVKGLATVPRDRVRLERAGVPEDRRAFLLDAEGRVITLARHPRLVQAVPDLDLDAGQLSVALPDGSTAATALADATEPVTATLYDKERTGRLLPGAVADALSDLAGEEVRVVVADEVGVGWDEGPVSLLGAASAAAVAGPKRNHRHFRMLVEVDGTGAYEEDTWVGRDLALGDARVQVVARLVRCTIITQSPTTGTKDWDGLKVLAEAKGPDLCLGVVAEVREPGEVAVGDAVRLLDG